TVTVIAEFGIRLLATVPLLPGWAWCGRGADGGSTLPRQFNRPELCSVRWARGGRVGRGAGSGAARPCRSRRRCKQSGVTPGRAARRRPSPPAAVTRTTSYSTCQLGIIVLLAAVIVPCMAKCCLLCGCDVVPLVLQCAAGAGVFELQILEFSNYRAALASGACCGGAARAAPEQACAAPCRTKFSLCLKEYQSAAAPGACSFGSAASPVLGTDSFTLAEPLYTLALPFSFRWTRSFTLILQAYDDFEYSDPEAGLVEEAWWSGIVEPSAEWHALQHAGAAAAVAYRVRVLCQPNYYNTTCTTFCRPRDDKFGHYSCTAEGAKRCLPGWQGDNCEKPVCKEGCHPTHGRCDRPGDCDCRPGWRGELCSQCQPYPGCKHGYCNGSSWDCTCDTNWGGILCDQDLNYCGTHEPCQHGGTCENTAPDQYLCRCAEGFSGTDCERVDNPCAPQPCVHGECSLAASPRGFACACARGWAGALCDQDVDDCASAPCRNGATCRDRLDAFVCDCAPGWTGPTCTEDINECEQRGADGAVAGAEGALGPCVNAAACNNTAGGYSCACLAGWTGRDCEANVDDCTGHASTCSTRTAASAPSASPAPTARYPRPPLCCLCPSSLMYINDAVSVARSGGPPALALTTTNSSSAFLADLLLRTLLRGKSLAILPAHPYTTALLTLSCRDRTTATTAPALRAGTAQPATRPRATTTATAPPAGPARTARSAQRKNRATRARRAASPPAPPRCACRPPTPPRSATSVHTPSPPRGLRAPAITPHSCVTEVNACATSPCRNNASCVDGAADFTCICRDGWTGKTCSTRVDGIEHCPEGTCANGGTCVREGGGWRCLCPSGWTGAACDTAPSPVAPACPCAAGGTCVPTAAPPGWACACREGRTGARCELPAEPCASAPCRNGGRCVGGAGWWACECAPGWSGDTCSVRAPACSPACPPAAACVPDPLRPERGARCVCPPPPHRSARRCLEMLAGLGADGDEGAERDEGRVRDVGEGADGEPGACGADNGTWWWGCNACWCEGGAPACTRLWCGLPDCHGPAAQPCRTDEVCVPSAPALCLRGPCAALGECRRVAGRRLARERLARGAHVERACAALRRALAAALAAASHGAPPAPPLALLCDLAPDDDDALDLALWIGDEVGTDGAERAEALGVAVRALSELVARRRLAQHALLGAALRLRVPAAPAPLADPSAPAPALTVALAALALLVSAAVAVALVIWLRRRRAAAAAERSRRCDEEKNQQEHLMVHFPLPSLRHAAAPRGHAMSYRVTLRLHWVPSHIGIQGKERADMQAKYEA
ncbi:hypothetical protein HW555_013309, partial [Spodoptera exigua]